MADPDELLVKIGADFSELKKALSVSNKKVQELGKKSKKTGDVASKSFDKTAGSLKGMSAGAIAAAASIATLVVGIGAFVAKQSQAINEMDKWGQRLDISTKKFSQFAAVGRKFGVDMDTVGDAIKDLNERIADAAMGNKTYEEALNKVGLASRDLINLPVEEQFLKVADAIGKMNNAGDRNFITAELMADAGFRLIPAFQQGEKAIRGMMKAADDMGESLSEEDVKNFKEMEEVFRELQSSGAALGNALLRILTPALKGLAEVSRIAADALVDFDKTLKSGLEKSDASKRLSDINDEAVKLKSNISAIRAEGGFFMSDEDVARVDVMKGKIKELRAEQESLRGGGDEGSQDSAPSGTIGLDTIEMVAQVEEQKEVRTEFDDWILARATALVAAEKELAFERYAVEEGRIDEFLDFKRDAGRAELKQEKMVQMANRRLWEQGAKGRMQIAGTMLSQLSVLMESENRKMFETGKAAATASAVIETIVAAQRSFSAMSGIPIVGPALGAVAAAAAVAAGVVRVQKIQSTTMGGGGGGASAAGGGGGVAAPSGPTGQAAEVGPAAQTTNFDINLQGESFSGEQIRGLIGQINEATDDGVKLTTNT